MKEYTVRKAMAVDHIGHYSGSYVTCGGAMADVEVTIPNADHAYVTGTAWVKGRGDRPAFEISIRLRRNGVAWDVIGDNSVVSKPYAETGKYRVLAAESHTAVVYRQVAELVADVATTEILRAVTATRESEELDRLNARKAELLREVESIDSDRARLMGANRK